MYPPLADTQRAFARALNDRDFTLPYGIAGLGSFDAKRRFAIYRNNVAASLSDALVDSFPVTQALVGQEFFRAMAREYVRENKPSSPVLLQYGAGFPDFIASFEPANMVPYLADVARIEAAWMHAYHAADATPCDIPALSLLGERAADAAVTLLPSARVVKSEFPAGSIWLAHKAEGSSVPEISTPESVLIWRPEMEVEVVRLEPAISAFVFALAEGKMIGEAAVAAVSANAAFDTGEALVQLVQSGIIQKFEGSKTP